jgi:hypothetical protein
MTAGQSADSGTTISTGFVIFIQNFNLPKYNIRSSVFKKEKKVFDKDSITGLIKQDFSFLM